MRFVGRIREVLRLQAKAAAVREAQRPIEEIPAVELDARLVSKYFQLPPRTRLAHPHRAAQRLAGGRGGIWGTMAGVIIFSLIDSIFNVIGMDAFVKQVVRGIIIVAAVAFYAVRSKRPVA